RLTKDFDIAPTNSAAPTCSKGLHRCLFCGKPGCVSLNAVGLRLAISDLFFGKNAAKEPLAKSCDGFRDTWNFGDVNSCADNHGSTLAWRLEQILRRGFTRIYADSNLMEKIFECLNLWQRAR